MLPIKPSYQLLLFFTLWLGLFGNSSTSHAQQDSTLLEEIINYQDESAKLIERSRLLIATRLEYGDTSQAAEVYDYIRTTVNRERYNIFTIEEELLINSLLVRHSAFLELARAYKPPKRSTFERHHPIPKLLRDEPEYMRDLIQDGLYARLKTLALPRQNSYEKTIRALGLPLSDEEAYLLIYGYILGTLMPEERAFDLMYTESDQLAMRVAAFFDNYPDSPYASFIKAHIGMPLIPADYGYSYEMTLFTGVTAFTDSLSTLVRNPASFTMGLDLFYKSLMLQTGMHFGIMNTKRDFTVDGMEWFDNERAGYGAFSIDLAYRLRMNNFTFSPFIGLANNAIFLWEVDSEIGTTGAWQYGFNLDFSFPEVNDYFRGRLANAFYLRLRGLIREPQFDRKHPGLEGHIWSLNLTLGFRLSKNLAYVVD